jgi:hypothetical protein
VNKFTWTKPYHGISHLTNLTKPYRISMNGVNDKTVYGYVACGLCNTIYESWGKLDYVKNKLQKKAKQLNILQ